MNSYLDASLASQWRSLAEVRMHYAPNGVEQIDLTTGRVDTFDASYVDLNDYTVDTRWGGIEIERVWLEYAPREWLEIKAGIWLTPYGIWNVDHGSPTIVGVRPPAILKQALFPERQAGLQVSGVFAFSDYSIGYAATVSNGRGKFDGIRDLDANKALGGRLVFETNVVGTLSVGASGYYGTLTNGARSAGEVEDPTTQLPTFDVEIDEQHDELSLAADVRFGIDGFLLQAEIMVQQVVYTDEGRVGTPAGLGGLTPDFARYGSYTLVGYRTDFVGLMPYAMFEHIDFGAPLLVDIVHSAAVGINARPTPAITLELQFNRHFLQTRSIAGDQRHVLTALELQTAWAF